jgi:exosortase/archaeosortase family protein
VRDSYVLLAFLAGLAISVCWRSSMLSSFAGVPAAILVDRSGIGAGELLVISVLFLLIFRIRNDDLLSPSDLVVIAITSVAFAVPFRLAAAAPLTIVGIKLLFRRDPRLCSIGQLLIALVFYEWLGPMVFHVLSPLVLRAEAFAVQALLTPLGGFARDDLIISASNGHAIYIEEGCSAFHNLSLATVIWISLVKLETLAMKSFYWWILAAMAAATVALNTFRIALIAQSAGMYEFWHNGSGQTIVSFAMLATVLGIGLGGLRLAENR